MAKAVKTDEIEQLKDEIKQLHTDLSKANLELVQRQKQYEELARSNEKELTRLQAEITDLKAQLKKQDTLERALVVQKGEIGWLKQALEEIALHPEASGTHQADLAKAALRGS